MSTKRRRSAGTASQGIHYVGAIATGGNCVFQKVDEENDQGNDAYIEFISDEVATSLFCWVQVKSGPSYRRPDGYAFTADKEHFEYWSRFPVPVVGIVYDPDAKSAVWVNVSDYLRSHPDVLENGPYTINIPGVNEFNAATFESFKQQIAAASSSSDWSFGQSLEFFADTDHQQRCVVGMSSLFANHRNRKATWFYLIHCFAAMKGPAVARLAFLLSHLPGHPHIFWHGGNIIAQEMEKYGKELLATTFGREEVLKLIGLVDAHGFMAGPIGYTVSTIIFLVREAQSILESIAFDDALDEEQRGIAVFLLIHYAQFHSVEFCCDTIDRYVAKFSMSGDCELLQAMKETLRRDGFLGHIGG